MNKQAYYTKIVNSLIREKFFIDKEDFSYKIADTESSELASNIRKGMKFLSFSSKYFGPLIGINLEIPELDSKFDKVSFKKQLKKIHTLTDLVFFKYVLSQPVILSLIEADNLLDNDFLNIFNQYNNLILEFRDFTGKMNFVKMSVTGLMVFCFFDSNKSERFRLFIQSKCKKNHLFKKVWIIPWAIDIKNKKIHKHSGLPFLPGVINAERVEKNIFFNH